jgi:NAD+ synthase (glutamine-hydrolysing)
MKICLAQLNYTIGDLEGNSSKIINGIHEAKANGAELVVFSELAISGYPPEDLLDYPSFVEEQLTFLDIIARECVGITAIVGAISMNKENGRFLRNTAFVLSDGEIKNEVHKTLLPTYDIFTESRYFEPNETFECVEIGGKKIAITICEDLWSDANEFQYSRDVLAQYDALNPDVVINISASPYHKDKFEIRDKVLRDNCTDHNVSIVYVNQVGVHTDLLFDGNSSVWNAKGEKIIEMEAFGEEMGYFQLSELDSNSPLQFEETDRMDRVLDAICFGIKEYFQKMGFKKCLLGSSGGIDSAVVQSLASIALGPENVLAVLMPSEYSSEGSVSDAEALSNNWGNPIEILPIKDVYSAYMNTLQPVFNGTAFNIAEENLQARARGMMLMAVSNKKGGILLNTSNKSEMAVGYSTLYGDMCGGLSPIGDLYKMEVYDIALRINKKYGDKIPEDIISKPPSAELRPGQKDSDSLPEYPILDDILLNYIERRLSAESIVELGYDKEVVNDVLKKVNSNEYKRYQAPPVLRVSNKAFGYGRRMPLVGKYPSMP